MKQEERLTDHQGTRALAKSWYWKNRRRAYLRMKRDGELDEFLDGRAERVERHAQNLVATGTSREQAIQWAIRAEIIGVDYD